ncbi:putative deoxyribonuclease TATDN1 [Zea mays]|uniref:Putative deoxyribonuclease TATDN1 n=1 Tax=Zea mays TaxID=4577 RepID=A0A3L6FCT9_MAIZE|nr:putative deoxyribonuclease TATDN1 [Zea mays]
MRHHSCTTMFGEGVVNDATSVVLFNAIQNFDPRNISGAKLLNFIGSFLYLFGSSTILGVASGLLSAYTIKKLYFGSCYVPYMILVIQVIVWWAGLMRGAVSIVLAYNKVLWQCEAFWEVVSASLGTFIFVMMLSFRLQCHRFCGSARHFGRDIIMPNLKSSVTTTASAVEYRDEVLKALPPDLKGGSGETPFSVGQAINSPELVLSRSVRCIPIPTIWYFEKQFELSEAVKLPMFLHMRAAGEDFCEIMTQNLHRFPVRVTHSFTDLAEDWDRLLSFENMFIGVNGCSLKTNENLEVLRGIPVERLMIETNSPYCDIINTHARSPYVKSVWPSKKKEKYEPDSTVKGRNEPCLVRQVLEVVVGSKGISGVEGLSRTLYHNTCRLFFPQDLDVSANAQL